MHPSSKIETIVLGGGCFWCTEAVFQMLRGIVSVTSGYTGGTASHPTYEQVSAGATGHVEAAKIEFDPSLVSVRDILAVFFSSHDPTELNRQGNDAGTQYRSAVFYTSLDQKTHIESYIQELTENHTFARPIVTEVAPLGVFYPAETYHQNYYRTHPDKAYCKMVIDPKIAKLRATYAHLLEERA